MLHFILRRLGAAAVLLLVVLSLTFFVVHLAPGDPFQLLLTPRMGPDAAERLQRLYGLDQPLIVQYFKWLRAMLAGDWGISFTHQRPAFDVLRERMAPTLWLLGATLVVEHVVGLALGLLAATRPGGWIDRLTRDLSLILYSVPIFFLGLVAIELFAVRWQIFPLGQMSSGPSGSLAGLSRGARLADFLHHLALPALVLGLARSGAVVRYARNGLLDVLGQDYIRAAHAAGIHPARVLWIHALKNALGPLVQRLGLSLSMLFSGALIVEVVFVWPGLGTTSFNAILERDYPLILAVTALSGVGVVLGTLVADVLHAWIDPRVRDEVGDG